MANISVPVPVPVPVPKRVFIVPYRDRELHKTMFIQKMTTLLEDEVLTNPYEIYFSHQCDKRPFNRGAMKNIGFLAIKEKYPNDYKNITFIFHDVDTWPSEKGLINYDTTPGVVSHFYGFTFALGGMFAIKGDDFEKTKGFPNFWGWGIEDNLMNDRCIKLGLTINRDVFYKIKDKLIVRVNDGFQRLISKRDAVVYKRESPDDLTYIKNLNYVINNEFINIYTFTCDMDPLQQDYANFDIRSNNKIKVPSGYHRRVWNMKKNMKL